MTDAEKREKVINGLECEIARTKLADLDFLDCVDVGLLRDALALLKAQEPPTDVSISSAIECLLHPQDADDSDMAKAIDTVVRAMRLLKAQEPVEPIPTLDDDWECGHCGDSVVGYTELDTGGFEPVKHNYCPRCGRAVKWE